LQGQNCHHQADGEVRPVGPIHFAEIEQHTRTNSQRTDLVEEVTIEPDFAQLLCKLLLEPDGTNPEYPIGESTDHVHPKGKDQDRNKVTNKPVSIAQENPCSESCDQSQTSIRKKGGWQQREIGSLPEPDHDPQYSCTDQQQEQNQFAEQTI
jgi:hypothetical protein